MHLEPWKVPKHTKTREKKILDNENKRFTRGFSLKVAIPSRNRNLIGFTKHGHTLRENSRNIAIYSKKRNHIESTKHSYTLEKT